MTPKAVRRSPRYDPPPAEHLLDLHIDAHIVVVDKPAGLLSVPGRGPDKTVCAASILTERHGDALIVHRLDMDTSGVMIFARDKDSQRHLSHSFERRLAEKRYEAVVEGHLDQQTGRIDLPIAKHSLQRPLRHIDPDGQAARTDWTVIGRTASTTRLRLTPHTGRSHQLRLHLSAIGHPILGDPFYGDEASAIRLLLHATSLSIPHPATGKIARYEAPASF